MRVYHRLDIRYLSVGIKYLLSAARETALETQRAAYARQLAELIASGHPVVYLDETSVHLQMTQRKTWQLEGTQLSATIHAQQQRLTLYGAIGACIDEQVLMIGQSTNAEEFCDFLELLIASVTRSYSGSTPVLALDNHRAHHATRTRRHLEHFRVYWLPPYSSPLNAIERLWAVVKRQYRQHLGLSLPSRPTSWTRLARTVLTIAQRVPRSTILALLTSNQREIVRLLEVNEAAGR